LIQFIEDLSDLGIHKAHACVIAVSQLSCIFIVDPLLSIVKPIIRPVLSNTDGVLIRAQFGMGGSVYRPALESWFKLAALIN
jgi:hypothetical protein